MNASFLTNGDTAITVQIADEINIANSWKVGALKKVLEEKPIRGVSELLPTFCALTIFYMPEVICYDELVAECGERLELIDESAVSEPMDGIVFEIPVFYGGESGYDLNAVAEYHRKTPKEIINIHTGHIFYAYMLGFKPGHTYLGADNELTIPRRDSPTANVVPGSIVVMKNQSVIEPIYSRTAWHVIGKTPVRVFEINQEDPFLIKAGMWVQFRAVSKKEYDLIEKQVEAGTYRCRLYKKRV